MLNMNIIELEDMVKGLPDDRLLQEAQSPSGHFPQFLTISEIQRRTDMRERFKAQQQQPQGTVADQVVQKGIASLPQAQPQMNMADGGIVRMQGGGQFSDGPYSGLYRGAVGSIASIPGRMNDLLKLLSRRGGSSPKVEMGMIRYGAEAGIPGGVEPWEVGITGTDIGLNDNQFQMPGRSMEIQGDDARVQATGLSGTGAGAGEIQQDGIGSLGDNLGVRVSLQEPEFRGIEDLIEEQRGVGPRVREHMAGLAEQQRESYQGFDEFAEEQRDDAWSAAMIEIGAGIARNKLADGLSRAGEVAMEGKRSARALEIQDRIARAENESKARTLESQGFMAEIGNESEVRQLIAQDRSSRTAYEQQQLENDLKQIELAATIDLKQEANRIALTIQEHRDVNTQLSVAQTMIREYMNQLMAITPEAKMQALRVIISELPDEIATLILKDADKMIRGPSMGSQNLSDQELLELYGE